MLEELKPNGLVNDDPEIYGAMDTELSGSSAVIPVALKADGSLKATSKTASAEEFGTMSDCVKETVTKAGKESWAEMWLLRVMNSTASWISL